MPLKCDKNMVIKYNRFATKALQRIRRGGKVRKEGQEMTENEIGLEE